MADDSRVDRVKIFRPSAVHDAVEEAVVCTVPGTVLFPVVHDSSKCDETTV